MALDDEDASHWGPDVHFYLCVDYVPFDKNAKLPTIETAKKVFDEMLNNLGLWLKDAEGETR